MIFRFVILMSLTTAACAQDTAASADTKKRLSTELAQIIGVKYPLFSMHTSRESMMKNQLYRLTHTLLLGRGAPCNLANSQCRAIGEEIAEKMVNEILQKQKSLSVHVYSLHFRRTMSASELEDTIGYLKTASGKKFAAALAEAYSPDLASEMPKDVMKFFTTKEKKSNNAFIEEFFERTSGLPRADVKYPPRPLPVAPRRK